MKKLFVFSLILIFIISCDRVNPTAPDEAVLHVSANPTNIQAGGATSIITVLGYKSTGIPLSNGTIIYFSSDIGSIDSTAKTRDGIAKATFRSDERSGVAHIYVTSGNATATPSPLEILVGTSALASLTIGANPVVLPVGGGQSEITVAAFNENRNLLPDIPVVFSTTAGTLDSGGSVLCTNQNGEVKDYLTTSTDATVTATSVSISASVTVSVETNSPPTASFVFSPTNPEAGDTVYFNASASSDSDGDIISYEWDFGDGSSGSSVQISHTYTDAGTFQVTLVVTDDDGATGVLSQTVTVS